ncbi:Spy/CpxP family protein refolding chaperone [Notoacmeibacter sp. MSK16QG-6]|uniref:Spy/CpxP family protein refolding chaperone n=1 Tax=Notoacmeibacter sp. MSK16QG-6 TaxID=2957982 RepID=UPI0020A05831|nr:hypothetical protein [Notoacmeibacter sp. MSK16QG-6]MCP1198624.1 hypothetical protein [Notoacmeibacter sp. MSK16QG-6]
MRRLIAMAAIALLSGGAFAAQNETQQPYADLQNREIKALSPERQDDLIAGRGAGFALAAELNGLPGPRHVLDMADEIDLKDDQRAEIQAIFDDMNTNAKVLGAELIAAEAKLDALFASGEATPDQVRTLTMDVAEIEAKLRATHLNAHLTTSPVLTQHQRMLYAQARGYGDGHAGHGAH